jgi:hypothetical protein
MLTSAIGLGGKYPVMKSRFFLFLIFLINIDGCYLILSDCTDFATSKFP